MGYGQSSYKKLLIYQPEDIIILMPYLCEVNCKFTNLSPDILPVPIMMPCLVFGPIPLVQFLVKPGSGRVLLIRGTRWGVGETGWRWYDVWCCVGVRFLYKKIRHVSKILING